MPDELAPRGPSELGRLAPPGPPLGPPPAHLGLGASRPSAVRQPARPPPANRRPTGYWSAQHGRGHRPVPAQPRDPARLGRRPSIPPRDGRALVEARPGLPAYH